MKSFLLLATIFGASFGGIWYLDGQGQLPEAYTGPAAAKAKPPPPRWYTVGEPFTLTMRGDHSVRLTVALQLPKKLPEFVGPGQEGAGRLRQEPVIRAVVTDTVMQRSARTLRTAAGRRELERLLRRRIRAHTDVRPRRVLLPDVIVH